MKKSIAFILTFIFMFCQMAFIGHAEGEEVLVIVNSGVAQGEISAKDLGNIFLGKKSSWDGGMKTVPVTLEAGDAHEKFLKSYIKKSSSQFSTFWKQAVFTGQGIPPKSVTSEADVVKFVNENAGAVGYILSSTPHDGVKVIAVK